MSDELRESMSSLNVSSFIKGSKNPDKDFEKSKKTTHSFFPAHLPGKLLQRDFPWQVSQSLFKRLKFKPGATEAYHKAIITQEDPGNGPLRIPNLTTAFLRTAKAQAIACTTLSLLNNSKPFFLL